MSHARLAAGRMSMHVHLTGSNGELVETLGELLVDEGCTVSSGGSVPHADVVVMDTGALSLLEVEERLAAFHCPVVAITADRTLPAGAHSALLKPFGVDTFLATVAAAGAKPLRPGEEASIRAYFAALSARRWDDVAAVCDEDVVYRLTEQAPVRGRRAFRDYTERTFENFREARFEVLTVAPLPRAVYAIYKGSWRNEQGGPMELPGALRFSIANGVICSIGVDTDTERLKKLGYAVAS